MTDLFGADLPVEGADSGVFQWNDGPLLKALKDGSWIVLDEVRTHASNLKTFLIKTNSTQLFILLFYKD